MSDEPVHTLQQLGFTELEARIYTALLDHSPATGYRIAQTIGKPVANTYKAIASLARKGALLVDDGHTRLCRATPPDELLDRLQREHRSTCTAARTALADLARDTRDDRVYQLESSAQTLERTRRLLSLANDLVLLDLFPAPFLDLRDDLVEAAARGVRVVAHLYEEVGEQPFEWTTSERSDLILRTWPGQQLSCVRDGEEFIAALLSDDLQTVHHAVWSSSTFLSCMQHNHLACELIATGSRSEETSPPGAATSASLEDIRLTSSGVSGLKVLVSRYGTPAGRTVRA